MKRDPSIRAMHSLRMTGFTLIELSIVLVIIGLIVGGVLVGQDLIKAAELRATISQKESYETAVNTFRLKYNGIPGDLNNAITFWGAAHATPATCKTTASTGAETCNGDGNKLVENVSISWEQLRFWQHLANAGLISGTFNGVSDTGQHANNGITPDVNAPAGPISGSAFAVKYFAPISSSPYYFDGSYGHLVHFGKDRDGSSVYDPLLEPADAMSIDDKIDDGRPGSGNVRTMKNTSIYTPGCATTDSVATAEYAATSSNKLCHLMFLLGF